MRSILNPEKKVILIFIPVLILVILAIGCGSSDDADTKGDQTNNLPPGVTIETIESPSPSADEPEEIDIEKAQSALEDFLSASDLHLKGEYSSVTADGMKDGPTQFEIWMKGEKVRIDDSRSNGPRSLIVSNGAALYYMHDTKHSFPSIMPPEYYTNMFGQDFLKATSRTSGDGKSVIFSIEIDAFYKNDNAQAGYYVTRVEYKVDNDSVLNHVLYGKDSYGTKPTALNAVTQTFSLVEINKGIADTVFNAPF